MRRPRWGLAVLAATLLSGGVTLAPPARATTGGDCGGADTPPARHLADGEECAGSMNEPATSSTTMLSGYIEHRYRDAYTFDHTDGDEVRVQYSGPACSEASPATPFIATGSGPSPVAITARRTANSDGTRAGPCPEQPGGYTIRVSVIPNDRPAVSLGAVQTQGQPGDTYTFTVSGTDPDADLTALGVRFGDSDNYDWKTQLLGSGSWSTTFSYQFFSDQVLRFYARDNHGALSPPSAAVFVDVGQNDCGLGRDAVVEAVSLPLRCEGWLDGASDIDTFTFTPSPGMRPRARVTTGPLQGYTLTLTSPSGVSWGTSDAEDPDLYGGAAEAGEWRASVQGDGDVMGYVLDITEVGPAAPPTLVVDAPPIAYQGDYYAFVMTGYDPNGQALSFDVDWGNGSHAIWPTYGRAASGEPVTGYRRFMWATPATWTVTVTVRNTEGLTATATFTVTVRPHNDCGIGDPDYDAPPTASGSVAMPATCDGALGYYLPIWEEDVLDSADVFQSPLRCLVSEACKVRVTLITEPGLAAAVTLDNVVSQHTSTCGGGGCTTAVETLGPTYPGTGYPRISITLSGGKGAYRLKVEKVPITAGLV